MAMAFLYRTLPGTDHPKAAYFTRGSGHNEKALYTERPDDYQNLMERLARKFETARSLVPAPESRSDGQVAGRVDCLWNLRFRAAREPRSTEEGIPLDTDYLRFRAFPFTPEVLAFVASHDRVYVVEQNRDAQMLSLLKLDLPAEQTPEAKQCAPLQWLAGRCAFGHQ